MNRLLTLTLCLLCASPLSAQSDPPTIDGEGNVQLPLDTYNALMERARDPKQEPRPAPAAYAIGKAEVTVNVTEVEGMATANVAVKVAVKVFEDEWIMVPLLSTGTAVISATVDGNAVQLVASSSGLGWSINKKGSYRVELAYSVDAARSEQGMAAGLPMPKASATTFNATLPGTGLDVAVIPSAGMRTSTSGDSTRVSATIPTTGGIHLSWRTPSDQGHAISRAVYSGNLNGDAVTWSADLSVELFSDETVTLELLPSTTTLNDIKVDNKSGTIKVTDDERFATLVKGRGVHRIIATFQVPVIRGDGPPKVSLEIPEIPVSRFDLTLPGKKEVAVEPASNVTNSARGSSTVATVYVPMTSEVTFTWSEAVPEAVKAELRANANIYHLVHAEEGVLYVRAMTVFDVTRGESNVLKFELPAGVQVNDVRADSGGVSEWIPAPAAKGKPQLVSVFLDRKVKGQFVFDVMYERKLVTGDKAQDPITVPVIRAVDVSRQRGMVALLASKEFTLKPDKEEQVTKVGENQLPAFVRQAVEMTIAHTYKYVEATPIITAQPAPPERKEGKFDAQVDTLISLSDVTVKGSTSIEVSVKSGGIMELQLGLPKGVNLLSLTAPSKRTHKLNEEAATADEQIIDVQFTQEMEGQFRVDVTYERIMAEGGGEVFVPTLNVKKAEVEQGRIAVEALTAVEVSAATTEKLSSLDINELPQQLILKTTNPILVAYRYVQPKYSLGLKVTRHQEIDVQAAAIDSATYRTLYTRDGLAVTTASFVVRNNREQFLRILLPEGSKVWSAFVDGKAEKPAIAGAPTPAPAPAPAPPPTPELGEGGSGGAPQESPAPTPDPLPPEPTDGLAPNILIKIINSSEGFPVELVYETPVKPIGSLGTVDGMLPRPDMIVTTSRWDVFLPDDITYGSPDTNMQVVEEGITVTAADMAPEVSASSGGQAPLRIDVPTSGIRYTFTKVYANRSDDDAAFAMSYTSAGGAWVAPVLAILGVLLLLAAAMMVARERKLAGKGLAFAGGGVVLLGVALYFGVHAAYPIVTAILATGGYGAYWLATRLGKRRGTVTAPAPDSSDGA